MVTVPGLNGGLSFVVNLQQFEYTEDTVTAGITLSVAQPGTRIVEQMTATAASPSIFVSLTFTATDVCLETKKPWSSCFGEAPESTQFLCRDQCSNRAIAKACGCRPMGDTQPDLKSLITVVLKMSCALIIRPVFPLKIVIVPCHRVRSLSSK